MKATLDIYGFETSPSQRLLHTTTPVVAWCCKSKI